MALPYLFASVSTLTTPQIDANFAALGKLTPIPCTIVGTNSLTLTQLANTPSVPAYANYMQFTGIAVQTNTGVTTATVGSLTDLPVYKASPSGPVVLSGGEIVANTALTLLYDSALNSGGGGFHLLTASATSGGGGSIAGNLTISGTVLASSVSASVINATASLVVGLAGNPMTRMLSTSSSVSWSAVNPQAKQDVIIPLPGASIGDMVLIGYPFSVAASIGYLALVSAPSTVTLRAFNYSSLATVTPTSGLHYITTMGFY